jgi:phosphoribosyl 1,2-cyclic phosphodiesterase/CheY-like chemotaxis protein
MLRSSTVLIRFWGTRGSIPTPGRGTTLYGGNTSCVEVRADDGTVIILDCGTGARPLGLDLLSRGPTLPAMHILVTHTHWDHIQGFPFFLPAYLAGTRLSVYGARGLDRTLEGSLSGQMQHTYFPVQLDELRADIAFEEVAEERFRVGPYRVTSQLINHTTATVAYRVQAGSVSIAYVTDHEPFWWERASTRQPHRFLHPGEERHVAFVGGADVLIHDAQYADTEYPAKRGWGHSTVEYAVDLAIRAGVKQLVLFHHDPTHSDAWIRTHLARARRRAVAQHSAIEIIAAAEGEQLELRDGHPGSDVDDSVLATPTGRILVVGSERAVIDEVREALAPDGYQVVGADDAELANAGARGRVDLLILVGPGSEASLLERAMGVRSTAWGAKLPILILAATEGPGAAGRLVDGATDVLSRPFNPAMLRPRVRAWLARSGTLVERRIERHARMISSSKAATGTRGFLRGLPVSQRSALMAGAVACRFKAGEIIFNEGDPAGGMYFIREGRVEMSMRLPEGRSHVLGTAAAGDTVGELAALDGGPRTATARVLEATLADYLPRDILEPSLAAAPDAAFRLMRLMAGRLRQTDRFIGELTPATGSNSSDDSSSSS